MSNILWKRLEELVAKDIGGVTRPGSGRILGMEEDAVGGLLLVQCKSNQSGSVTIPKADMNDLGGHAMRDNKIPVMVGANRQTMNMDDYLALIPKKHIEKIMETIYFDLTEAESEQQMEIDLNNGKTWSMPMTLSTMEFTVVNITEGREGDPWGDKAILMHRKEFLEAIEEGSL